MIGPVEIKHVQKTNFPDHTLCGKERFRDKIKFGIGNRGNCPECLAILEVVRKQGATPYMKTAFMKRKKWLEGEFRLPLGDGNPGGKR